MGLFGPSKLEVEKIKNEELTLANQKLNSDLDAQRIQSTSMNEQSLKEIEALKNEILFLKNADQNIKQNEDKILFNQRQIVVLMTRIKLNASASYVQLVDLYDKKKSIINIINSKFENYSGCDRVGTFRKLDNSPLERGEMASLVTSQKNQGYQGLQSLHAIVVRIDELSQLIFSEQKVILDQTELLSTLESHTRLNDIQAHFTRDLSKVITEEFSNWLKKENPESDKVIAINKKIEELFIVILNICKNLADEEKLLRNQDFNFNLSQATIRYCGLEKEHNSLIKELDSFKESIRNLTNYIIQETVETHKIELDEYTIKNLEKAIEREIVTKARSNITILKSINRNIKKK